MLSWDVKTRLILPFCNKQTMSLHLAEISLAIEPGAHGVVLMDQSARHRCGFRRHKFPPMPAAVGPGSRSLSHAPVASGSTRQSRPAIRSLHPWRCPPMGSHRFRNSAPWESPSRVNINEGWYYSPVTFFETEAEWTHAGRSALAGMDTLAPPPAEGRGGRYAPAEAIQLCAPSFNCR